MKPVIEIQNWSAGYGPLRVLQDVELAVMPGERVGLVGLNGHGKTTLLRSLIGLAGWRRGVIQLDGSSIRRLPPHRLARAGVVLMPQGDELFPGLSVRDNLDAGAFASGWRERRKRRERVLEIFPRLVERLSQQAGTLSGGERRMCSIGRGLMANARVYLIDEPSLGLAPSVGTSLVHGLMDLDLDGGALLIAEQNQALVDGLLHRTFRVHGGTVAELAGGRAGSAPGTAATLEKAGG